MLEGEESSWRETLIVIENRRWTIVTDPTFTDRSYLRRPKFTFVHSPPEHCHEISWTSEKSSQRVYFQDGFAVANVAQDGINPANRTLPENPVAAKKELIPGLRNYASRNRTLAG
jgi:hypothetical protein